MSAKQKYRTLCRQHPIHLFMQDWYLDAVAGDQWDVALLEKGNEVQGAWVYVVKSKWGVKWIGMPKLSTYVGIWLHYPEDQKPSTKIAFEKKAIQALYDQLPDVPFINQRMHPNVSNWLPLYWQGFTQTTRYSYRLSLQSTPQELWQGLDSRMRRAIKKSEKRFKVSVIETDDIEQFYAINRKTYERQGKSMNYSLEDVQRIDAAAKELGARQILLAVDDKQQVHAGLYLLWDSNTTYYLMGGADEKLRHSEANVLLLWRAILFAKERGSHLFDFEGSMKESIEKVFRSFGGTMTPYFRLTYARYPWLRLFLSRG